MSQLYSLAGCFFVRCVFAELGHPFSTVHRLLNPFIPPIDSGNRHLSPLPLPRITPRALTLRRSHCLVRFFILFLQPLPFSGLRVGNLISSTRRCHVHSLWLRIPFDNYCDIFETTRAAPDEPCKCYEDCLASWPMDLLRTFWTTASKRYAVYPSRSELSSWSKRSELTIVEVCFHSSA